MDHVGFRGRYHLGKMESGSALFADPPTATVIIVARISCDRARRAVKNLEALVIGKDHLGPPPCVSAPVTSGWSIVCVAKLVIGKALVVVLSVLQHSQAQLTKVALAT